MKYKGYCLWADDIPTPEAPHYIVVVSEENPENQVLVVAISSIKYVNGKEKYYDKACTINVGDILDEKGNSIIKKPSFIRYQYATELSTDILLTKQISRIYQYKTKISDELLRRIQEGAKVSQELEPRLKKYFDLF